MAQATVNKQMQGMGLSLSRPENIFEQGGPMRLSNRGFMEDFHKIYYRQPETKNTTLNQRSQVKSSNNNQDLRMSRTGHGAGIIDFDLQDEIIETKIRDVTDDIIRQSQHNMNQKINHKSQQLRSYVDMQLKKNDHYIHSMQDDMRLSERQIQRDIRNMIEVSGSFDFKQMKNSFGVGGSQSGLLKGNPNSNQQQQRLDSRGRPIQSQNLGQNPVEDYKTKLLKQNLTQDIQMTILAQNLDCKPIEGHDLPFSDLQKTISQDIKNQQRFQAQLLEVDNLESNLPNEIKQSEEILKMLIPSALKKPKMEFLDVEELQTVKTVSAPQTQAQKDRETYEEVLEKDRLEMFVTDEHRKKTIKCLLKVIDFQVKDIEGQAKHIEDHFKRNDEEIKEFEKFLKKEENRLIMENIQRKMNQARDQVHTYDDYDPEKDDGKELVDVANIIVENKLLLDRIDQAMGVRSTDDSDRSILDTELDDENSKLSQSFLDQMYKDATKRVNSKGKFKPASINMQFGRAIVDTHLQKNRKYQIQKSKSRTRTETVTKQSHFEHQEVKVLNEDLQKIKQQRKEQLSKKIQEKLTPTKIQKAAKSTTSKVAQKVDRQINKEIKNAMNEMANVIKVAFKDDPKQSQKIPVR
eukprot:403375862